MAKNRNGFFILQTAIFAVLSAFLVIFERLDLFQYFGAPPGTSSWQEIIIEVIVIAVLYVVQLFITSKLVRRLQFLENFMIICSSCNKVKTDDKWVPLVEYLSNKSGTQFSHGLCPDCTEKYKS